MQQQTFWGFRDASGPIAAPLDALLELGAYEALWSRQNASFKSIADRFRDNPDLRPSDLVPLDEARAVGARVLNKLRNRTGRFDVRIHGETEYPERLRDATHPLEFFYFQGNWALASTPAVAVVGTRKPSQKALERARFLAKKLVADGFTVVSGLAEGIDTAAHSAAIEGGGQTIAVIGTPLGEVYPKRNAALQEKIAREYLLISQVPVERYEAQDFRVNRFFFPERNKTMAALTQATIIVEAGETSGTLVQAREALKQKRKLFIMNSCFENSELTWPRKFELEGAIRVNSYADVRRELVGTA
ncbi:DNA-processing protein DprA [Sphingopyxis sp. 113P3]|uniref:DNA-processing protein DprA n=1 Tax=Sphingopyxis sp. (strain 113P3) TaxID=292913 RepID=UPI0006AD0F51|nr:DNA-processing protein DprA [Sphingopyxis sp. 113P3]ALC13052.1 DNA-binding protein [Sphingopyxis sp. 113P3]